ncbi:hypothetical protein T12_14601 [Trichinella patagoniensis]|uniref:Uncharacterized protein n=1 Tax=Trichinella patagoniensis TaxID=990121 RepID=A0A0V0Z0H9_9BILA|nr:hypothetical protein T12_14601 [Trichinella patagoniensis]
MGMYQQSYGSDGIVFKQNLQDSLIYRYVDIASKRIQNFDKNIFHPKRKNSKCENVGKKLESNNELGTTLPYCVFLEIW